MFTNQSKTARFVYINIYEVILKMKDVTMTMQVSTEDRVFLKMHAAKTGKTLKTVFKEIISHWKQELENEAAK